MSYQHKVPLTSSLIPFYESTSGFLKEFHQKDTEVMALLNEYSFSTKKYPTNALHSTKDNLQKYWQRLTEENEIRNQRNQLILSKLGSIEDHMNSLSSKSETLRRLRKQYSDALETLSNIRTQGPSLGLKIFVPETLDLENATCRLPVSSLRNNTELLDSGIQSSAQETSISTAAAAILPKNQCKTVSLQTPPELNYCSACKISIDAVPILVTNANKLTDTLNLSLDDVSFSKSDFFVPTSLSTSVHCSPNEVQLADPEPETNQMNYHTGNIFMGLTSVSNNVRMNEIPSFADNAAPSAPYEDHGLNGQAKDSFPIVKIAESLYKTSLEDKLSFEENDAEEKILKEHTDPVGLVQSNFTTNTVTRHQSKFGDSLEVSSDVEIESDQLESMKEDALLTLKMTYEQLSGDKNSANGAEKSQPGDNAVLQHNNSDEISSSSSSDADSPVPDEHEVDNSEQDDNNGIFTTPVPALGKIDAYQALLGGSFPAVGQKEGDENSSSEDDFESHFTSSVLTKKPESVSKSDLDEKELGGTQNQSAFSKGSVDKPLTAAERKRIQMKMLNLGQDSDSETDPTATGIKQKEKEVDDDFDFYG